MEWPEYWICASWPDNAQVRGVFTSRHGGNSVGPYGAGGGSIAARTGGMNLGSHVGDDPAAVAANRAHLGALFPGLQVVYLDQVHGTEVADLDNWDRRSVPQADAAVTTTPGLAACVLVADCLPVLFAAPGGTAVAAAHAGWRGLAGGVLENTLKALCGKVRCEPSAVQVWLGPAIGPLHFEVGEDVREAFVARQAASEKAFRVTCRGKWMADLFLLARLRLEAAGVSAALVHGGGVCTVSERQGYYTFRHDRITGRQAGLVWIAAPGITMERQG